MSEVGSRNDVAARPFRHRYEFGHVRRAKHKPEFEVHDHVPHLLRDHGEMPEGIPQIAYMGIPADGPAVG